MIGSSDARRAAAVALAMALLAAPLRARAQPTTAPTEEQVEAARALYKEARELHRRGHLKEAIDRALEAYRVASTPVTALEAGRLLVEAGRLVEARDVVRSVALLPVSPRESDKGRDARQQAVSLGAALDGRIPKVAVAERPRDLDVVLDGRALPPSEGAAWQGVDPGSHALVVRDGERTCTTIAVVLAEGEARTIDLHDAAIACRPDAKAATASDAAVTVAPAPRAPPRPITSAAEPAPAHGDGAPVRVVGIVLAAAGVAGVALGGYLALGAKGDYDAVASECRPRCTASAYDARQSARGRADVATAAMLAGAAAITGGALVFFLGGRSGAAHDAAIARPRVAIGPMSVDVTLPFR
jgi:hypothetical protein